MEQLSKEASAPSIEIKQYLGAEALQKFSPSFGFTNGAPCITSFKLQSYRSVSRDGVFFQDKSLMKHDFFDRKKIQELIGAYSDEQIIESTAEVYAQTINAAYQNFGSPYGSGSDSDNEFKSLIQGILSEIRTVLELQLCEIKVVKMIHDSGSDYSKFYLYDMNSTIRYEERRSEYERLVKLASVIQQYQELHPGLSRNSAEFVDNEVVLYPASDIEAEIDISDARRSLETLSLQQKELDEYKRTTAFRLAKAAHAVAKLFVVPDRGNDPEVIHKEKSRELGDRKNELIAEIERMRAELKDTKGFKTGVRFPMGSYLRNSHSLYFGMSETDFQHFASSVLSCIDKFAPDEAIDTGYQDYIAKQKEYEKQIAKKVGTLKTT